MVTVLQVLRGVNGCISISFVAVFVTTIVSIYLSFHCYFIIFLQFTGNKLSTTLTCVCSALSIFPGPCYVLFFGLFLGCLNSHELPFVRVRYYAVVLVFQDTISPA